MWFTMFFNKSYLSKERKKVLYHLKQTGIYDDIEQHTKDLFGMIESRTTEESRELYANLIIPFFLVLVRGLKSIHNEKSKKYYLDTTIRLSFKLILECNRLSGLDTQILLTIVLDKLDTLQVSDVHEVLKYKNIFKLIEAEIKCSDEKTNRLRLLNISPLNYFIWNTFEDDGQDVIRITIFIREIKKYIKSIRPVGEIILLFDEHGFPFKLILSPNDLPAFILLIWEMLNCGRISLPKPGLYAILQAHLEPPQGEKFPYRNCMRKIKVKVMADKVQKEKVYKQIEPLLLKYGKKTEPRNH